MKRARIIALAASISVSAGTLSLFPAVAADKEPVPGLLDVSSFIIQDENFVHLSAGTYLRNVSCLFDDQDKVPASPDDLKVSADVLKETSRANWTPNQQMEYGPASCCIDMGANYVITAIAFFDTNGTPTWTVSAGEPFGWKDVAKVNMDYYNSWRVVKFDSPEPTRYLHFSSDYCDSGVSEVAIYGYKQSELTDKQRARTAPKDRPYPTGDGSKQPAGSKIGFNAFIDDPMTAMMSAGTIREYHNLSWLLDKDGKVKFTQGSWGDMDSYYKSLHGRGINIIPCFQGGSTVISGGEKANEIPVPAGADTTDPKSYAVHAQAMYQVAARYGSNADIDPETLNITDAQEAKTGLGLLTALENSNEPNKSWAGKANYFSPFELAAMCSADYDGHEGTIPNAGVHTADRSFKLAMGGLVGYSTMIQYLDQMKQWFDYNRSDGKFAVDIINVHIGPDSDEIETGRFKSDLDALRAWINENAPGTELWVSEFEVPMSDCETEGVDNHDNEEYQLRYAQRVARTYLTSLAHDRVDYITKFQLRDEGEGVYYNSGLVTQKGKWDKKLAWYYLSCMSYTLRNAVWEDEYFGSDAEDGYCVNTFRDAGNERILIKCANTLYDKANGIYTISAEGRKYAYLTIPETEKLHGSTLMTAVQNDSLRVTLSQTPVFITLSDEPLSFEDGSYMLCPSGVSLSQDGSSGICDLTAAPEDAALGQYYRMFDEPDTMPYFVYGNTSTLTAPKTNSNRSGIGYVFFERPCVFNGFAVYDTYGVGGISVYDAKTDKLLWSSSLDSYMSRSVTLTDNSEPTDCLKIVREGGDLNEVAFYGYIPKKKDWDANSDGRVDVFDLILIRRVIYGKGVEYNMSDLVGATRFVLGMDK